MADPHFLSSLPTLVLGATVAASYAWLALRRITGDPDADAAIHLAAGIFWSSAAYTARAGYWGLSSLAVLPSWALDYALWLDVGCNLAFAYGGWRAHLAILLLLPAERRGRVRGWLAYLTVPGAPQPERRLSRLGRALRRVTGRRRLEDRFVQAHRVLHRA